MNHSLLDLLRGGGYILYTRHGHATVGEDQYNLNFQDCSTQRNLTDYGRRQAVYYGEMLRYLQIPVGYPVITSPFCRNIETAQLAFGNANLQVDPFLYQVYMVGKSISASEQNRILNMLASRLEIVPPQGSNQVIVAHSFPTGIGLGSITNMGTVIIRPLGAGKGFEIVSRLALGDLQKL